MVLASSTPGTNQKGPIRTNLNGNFVRTRASDLAVLRTMSQSETGILTLIHVESTGWGQSWTRTGILVNQFAAHSNTESRPCQDALKGLEQEGLIVRRKSKTGKGWEYRRIQPIDYTGLDAEADCPDCKKRTRFTLDRDVPIPHSLFLKVQQAVEHGTFMVILLISLETLRWKENRIWAHRKEIKIDEIARRVGLSKSEVEADLKKAEQLGAIGSSGNRGEIQTFWALPDAWENFKPRPRRKGGNLQPFRKGKQDEENGKDGQGVDGETQTGSDNRMGDIHASKGSHRDTGPGPTGKGEDTAKQDRVSPTSEKKDDKRKISPVDFWKLPCGHCSECGYHGPVEKLYDVEKVVRKPIETARGAPPAQISPWGSHKSHKIPADWKKEA